VQAMYKEELVIAIRDLGYRHLDASWINEIVIGQAIAEVLAGGLISREELFITTKIRASQFKDVKGALKRSL